MYRLRFGYKFLVFALLATSCINNSIEEFDPSGIYKTNLNGITWAAVLLDGTTVALGPGNQFFEIECIGPDGVPKGDIKEYSSDTYKPRVVGMSNGDFLYFDPYPDFKEYGPGSRLTSSNDSYYIGEEYRLRGYIIDIQPVDDRLAIYYYSPDGENKILIEDNEGIILASSKGSPGSSRPGEMVISGNNIYYNYGRWDNNPSKYALRKVDKDLNSVWGNVWLFDQNFTVKPLPNDQILVKEGNKYFIFEADGSSFTDVSSSQKLPDDYYYLGNSKFAYFQNKELYISDSYLEPDPQLLKTFDNQITFATAVFDGSLLVATYDSEGAILERIYP